MSTPKEYAKQKCDSFGWSNEEYNCLVSLWEKESNWDVSKGDPSGPYGIPQANPGTKMKDYGDDYKTNYKTQINWGLDYIKLRYGTPSAAWAFFKRKKWY